MNSRNWPSGVPTVASTECVQIHINLYLQGLAKPQIQGKRLLYQDWNAKYTAAVSVGSISHPAAHWRFTSAYILEKSPTPVRVVGRGLPRRLIYKVM